MDSGFDKLDPIIQKWVYKQGWEDLREIQKLSINPIFAADKDLVISASTAAGKTEAAFLPAMTKIADNNKGFGILYISPLKALINDQYRRLEGLCEMMDMDITMWHGDAPIKQKNRVIKDPSGIILITPESLESLLIRKAGWVKNSFNSIKYIIIDEYHAFLGYERGTQLQSLLHRLENLLGKDKSPIPRIALSATLGEMYNVLKSLRPNSTFPSELISSDKNRSNLKMLIKGYIHSVKPEAIPSEKLIADDLYNLLRGESNLIFANSRQRTEGFAALLSDLCEENFVPNEFYPHHGSLSKEIRTELESRLQKETLPTTAVCTMTLELGIDIGKVKTVCQVTAPHSVSSLRQRIGRSGRRGESAILRMFISENEIEITTSLGDKLRLELLQSSAMIRLLLIDKWYEPADLNLCHFSTLLHQILAVIAQWGGVRADQIWDLLCESGTFTKITIDEFKLLLNHMGEKSLITQISSGELTLAEIGERLVDHYTFYGVFKTPEEYRVVVEGKTIGTIPIDSFLIVEQHTVFSGRRWKVTDIEVQKKIIHVTPSKGGKPPKFCGDGMSVQNLVRQEMFKIYKKGDYKIDINGTKLDFMDETANSLFFEGLKLFNQLKLETNRVIGHGKHVYIIPWMGDKIVNTITMLLIKRGYKASNYAGVIELGNAYLDNIKEYLHSLITDISITDTDLAEFVKNKETEKFDNLLPEKLLNKEYGVKAFDIKATMDWLKKEIKLKHI